MKGKHSSLHFLSYDETERESCEQQHYPNQSYTPLGPDWIFRSCNGVVWAFGNVSTSIHRI